jgi:predicted phosphodiesterase
VKLLILSDLHLEMGQLALQEGGRRIDAAADVVVFAGDVKNGLGGAQWAREAFPNKQIVMVAGNHELFGLDWESGIDQLRGEANAHGIHFLENQAVEIDGVRFLGCSMWTDFCLHGPELQKTRMREVALRMSDFTKISHAGTLLTPEHVLARHLASRAWLQHELQDRDSRKTVAVTHHAPAATSIHQYDLSKPVATAYASDLEDLMGYCGLWIHGHVHEAADYIVNGTRVVCNPRGYLDLRGDAFSDWDPCFTIDI